MHGSILGRAPRGAAIALALGLLATVGSSTASQAQQLDSWQPAAPVDGVNGPATEGCPIEAPDGQSIYLMSTRGAGGDQDIWVAARQDDGGFGEPEMLPEPINSDANDFCPTPLRGKGLLFVSTRGGVDAFGTAACGGGDLYLARLSPATGEWSAPRNLGCAGDGGPNGSQNEFGPSLIDTDEGALLFFSAGGAPGAGTQEIVVSRQQADGSFGPADPVVALNTTADDMMPNVRKDGLEVVFASTRPGGQGAFDIWSSTRVSLSATWTQPVNLGPAVNGAGAETRPSLSWDGSRLYFGRAGDIFVSTR